MDGKKGIIGVLHEADKLVGKTVECSDPTTTELTDQNRVAKLTKVVRRPHHTPRCIHPWTGLEAALKLTGRAENIDKTQAISAYGIVSEVVLPGIRDEQAAADILHVERCETLRDRLVLKGLGAIIIARLAQSNGLKVSVVDFDLPLRKFVT